MMRSLLSMSAALVVALSLTACGTMTNEAAVSAEGFPTRTADGLLVGPNGMTVYTYAKDGKNSGMSECYDECAKNWPPLTVAPGTVATKEFPLIIRMDGTRQVTLEGQPLYYYAKDTQRGETTGDGRGEGAWKLNRR
jgi:predicted lipoprotein with Yx(FWY)xxD motif